jgi:2-polyprenyl-3-methyl-5-hydroxy-6-metoxy-1,4-benzoquinol methylase
MATSSHSGQGQSLGDSCPDIHRAALVAANPHPNLTWLDIGCGTGSLLRIVLQSYKPARLAGLDVIDWLEDDLRPHVELIVESAEQFSVGRRQLADRVLLVETIEHLEAPWSVLREACRRVAPGGRIVVTTPNIASLRHRLELFTRGNLTAFRPDNLAHVTPVLPHVVRRVLIEEGIQPCALCFVGRDVIPWTGGRLWPRAVQKYLPRPTSVSVVIAGDREGSS